MVRPTVGTKYAQYGEAMYDPTRNELCIRSVQKSKEGTRVYNHLKRGGGVNISFCLFHAQNIFASRNKLVTAVACGREAGVGGGWVF